MNHPENNALESTEPGVSKGQIERPERASSTTAWQRQDRKETRRWWLKMAVQPMLFLGGAMLLFVALGAVQKLGWLSSADDDGAIQASASDENVRYFCPMMCTPPLLEPGKCPVCGMKLKPMASGGSNVPSSSIQIDPAARRIANIRTVAVQAKPMSRTIRAIGELSYDEGTLKTISAYVDGRLDRLYADYTGVVVAKGDNLALVYSPRLYSGQFELLLAKKALEESRSSTLQRVVRSSHDLYESTKQRLIELGMTEAQIEQIEKAGDANSRMHLVAPISGTVIEKLAVEGQYIKEGQAIYKLADLTTVWLVLELFPEDAATIQYGQKVEAIVQSLPGRTLTGRVAFVAPTVDPKTRTVGVRVVIPNQDGLLRVGDFAKATIEVRLTQSADPKSGIYDPDLADKWISPRHPHVVESTPGKCRICGVDLVPAARFGFVNEPSADSNVLVIPRNAVLMAADNSIVYVETDPGRFEIRRVVLGPTSGNQIVILDGVAEGEHVATHGNFLIDSAMQIAGNPSLIDPMKAVPTPDESPPEELIAALSGLSVEDRELAEKQRICPVTRFELGSMGTPPKVEVNGTTVFLCCLRCKDEIQKEPEKYLSALENEGAPKESSQDEPMDLPPIGTPELVEAQDDVVTEAE